MTAAEHVDQAERQLWAALNEGKHTLSLEGRIEAAQGAVVDLAKAFVLLDNETSQ